MAENPRLFERVELFTRATSDAFNKAIGEVLDAKCQATSKTEPLPTVKTEPPLDWFGAS